VQNININSKIIFLALVICCILMVGSVSASDADSLNNMGNSSSVDTLSADNVIDKIDKSSEDILVESSESGDISDDELDKTVLGANSHNNENILNADELEDRDFYISPDGKGKGVNSSDCTNLTYAFNHISPNHSIFFTEGTYNKVKLIVTKSVNFIGLGGNVVIDQQNSNIRVFEVRANTATSFHNLKIKNIAGTDIGMAIQVVFGKNTGSIINHAEIDVKDCLFENVNSAMWGACVAMNARNIQFNITNCTFLACKNTNTKATGACGPAITINGDWARSETNGTFYIKDCLFENCNSLNSDGGAMRLEEFNTYVINCTFIKNKSLGSVGGAISCYSDANILNCTFINNTAGCGGAISYHDFENRRESGGIINGCTFIDDRANNDTSIHSIMGGHKLAFGRGGAIYFDGSDTTISNCTFINSFAPNGGAVFFYAANSAVKNCTFINNTAREGGAVKFNAKNSYMEYCTYINNTATIDGGALCSNSQGSTVAYCNFEGNDAPKGFDFYAHDGCEITFIGLKFSTLWLTNSNDTRTIGHGFGTSYDNPAAWENDGDYYGGFLNSFLNTKNGKVTIYLVGVITNLDEKILSIPNLEIVGYDKDNNPGGATVDLSGWNHRAFSLAATNIMFKNILFKNSNLSNSDGGVIKVSSSRFHKLETVHS